MTGNTTVRGIVLTSMIVGEYDRRLTLLTRERGKISAFARGARRQNSALLAVSQPFTYAEFCVFEGRSSYNIVSAEHVNYFPGLRNDVNAMYCGMYFCELADHLTRENNDEGMLLKLLYQSLRALERAAMPWGLIRHVYELKAISLFGEAPQVFECVSCGKEASCGMFFSPGDGGILCSRCAAGQAGGSGCRGGLISLSQSALYALQYVVTTPIEKLFSFCLADEVYDEFKLAVNAYMESHTDAPLKSLEVLSQLK